MLLSSNLIDRLSSSAFTLVCIQLLRGNIDDRRCCVEIVTLTMKANGVISNKIPLPYNSYNVFYILERERIIHERNGKQTTREESSDCDFNWYGSHLEVPSLPPRYIHLESTLAPNWYIPGARKLAKRKHVKSHGGE